MSFTGFMALNLCNITISYHSWLYNKLKNGSDCQFFNRDVHCVLCLKGEFMKTLSGGLSSLQLKPVGTLTFISIEHLGKYCAVLKLWHWYLKSPNSEASIMLLYSEMRPN